MEAVDGAHVVAVHCATAQSLVQEAVDARQEDIAAWLAATKPKAGLTFRVTTDEVVGTVLTRAAWEQRHPPVNTDRFIVVLRRSSTSPTGFVVYTAYPV
jgi:hypothetical protein